MVPPGTAQNFTNPFSSTFAVTDIVLQNPNGDTGVVQIKRDGNILMQSALENFRDLDLHFVAPYMFNPGSSLIMTVTCTQPINPQVASLHRLAASRSEARPLACGGLGDTNRRPDGDRIGGGSAKVSLLGGPAELISVDSATGGALASADGRPSVSGDGSIVVFSSSLFINQPSLLFQEDVWVRNRAARTTTHVHSRYELSRRHAGYRWWRGQPGWLPCSGAIFFDFPGEWNIYEWNRCVAGSISVQIAGGVLDDSAFTQPLAVSADGRYVAYIATQASGLPPHVARIDTTTGVESALTHPYSNVFSLDISDDGRFIALSGQLTVAGVATSQIMGWTAPCAAMHR